MYRLSHDILLGSLYPYENVHTFQATSHWHHTAYAHHYADHGSWLGHTIVSAIIHGLIYGAIFRLFRGMPQGEVLVVAVVGLLVVGGGYWWWNARRNLDE